LGVIAYSLRHTADVSSVAWGNRRWVSQTQAIFTIGLANMSIILNVLAGEIHPQWWPHRVRGANICLMAGIIRKLVGCTQMVAHCDDTRLTRA
jgi:hypothetical protein